MMLRQGRPSGLPHPGYLTRPASPCFAMVMLKNGLQNGSRPPPNVLCFVLSLVGVQVRQSGCISNIFVPRKHHGKSRKITENHGKSRKGFFRPITEIVESLLTDTSNFAGGGRQHHGVVVRWRWSAASPSPPFPPGGEGSYTWVGACVLYVHACLCCMCVASEHFHLPLG